MNNTNCSSGGIIERVWSVPTNLSTKTTRASLLMLLDTILMGVVVFVGAYARPYRRHPVIGILFVGATALFLPIVTTIVTTVDSVNDLINSLRDEVTCSERSHLFLVFLWTGVVVVIGINSSEAVAGDAREGRNIGIPIILVVKAIWSTYLIFSTWLAREEQIISLGQIVAIMFAKLVFKYASFYKAQRSFALGRNPRLIAGYMAELQQQQLVPAAAAADEHTEPAPPALIVMGEDKVQVEQQPHGYNLKQKPSQGDSTNSRANGGLVTLDQVWGQTTVDVRSKDLCFSFALFKMLRCRFAKYTFSEAGFVKTSKFFRETLLRSDDYRRVFGIITAELSFISDYYYSSLPMYYSLPLLPALGFTLSLWSIGYCIYLTVLIAKGFEHGAGTYYGQVSCELSLTVTDCGNNTYTLESLDLLGNLYYDAVPLYSVVTVLVLAETREIVSYICSNWTKVALIYHHVNQAWWQRCLLVQKCISCLIKYRRCKLVNNWNDKMQQCSILVLCPRRTSLLLRRLLRLRGRQKNVKVPNAVKAAIFEALRGKSFTSTDEQEKALWIIRAPSPPISVSLDSCCNCKRPAYTILVWHIATTIFEVSQLPQPSDHKTVATHLSRYCAYLVTSRPGLLPDDAEWCRGLYNEVRKDADRLLAKVKGAEYHYHEQLIRLLSADESNHEVLRNGARLGKELVASAGLGWEALARFWVEMVLYVAPSENLEGHAEAISHGGELITLLWALLAHAGIVDRLDAGAVAAASNEELGNCL